MSRMDYKVHLSYKDVLLVPYDADFVNIKSRNDPDISTEFCPGKKIQIPLISAPMDSITGPHMAIAMSSAGCLGIMTRYINDDKEEISKQIDALERLWNVRVPYRAVAIGVKDNVESKCMKLCDCGATVICLDIANGNHIFMKQALQSMERVKEKYKDISIIAGNIATAAAAKRLADYGADAVKVGIGPGAVCTTRRVTSFGVPQFTAVMECSGALKDYPTKIIADGGVRTSGDVVKSLWAGADAVMAGYIFAGCNETPRIDGHRMYRGMSSRTVSRRSDIAAEGICMEVENKGPVADVIKEYAAAIRAACSMANAMNLEELRKNVKAIRVSTMSNEESEPINARY